MPSRPVLAEKSIAPAALSAMNSFHAALVQEVEERVRRDRVVVVGMAQNPHVRKVREALAGAGVTHTYLEYGSYFSKWRERLAIEALERVADVPAGVRERGAGRRLRSDQGSSRRWVAQGIVGRRRRERFGVGSRLTAAG